MIHKMERMKMGILGAGGIAATMAQTVAQMPEVELYAVAARDEERARAFAAEYGIRKAYGTYDGMAEDPDVELIYIATPHSHHFDHAMLCLDRGKHVLCEKAFTANAPQAQRLICRAKEMNLLITEALWTRFMPLSAKINELVADGAIGEPRLLTANLGYPISHIERVRKPELAGGALLDIGVYTINFASMVFGSKLLDFSASAVMTPEGVDCVNNITLRFEDGRTALLYSTSLVQTDREGIVYGDNGRLVVDNINSPERVRVLSPDGVETARFEAPPKISGYEYEVLSTIKAIREKQLECPEMPHSETLRIMQLMDDIRASWGMRYPFE